MDISKWLYILFFLLCRQSLGTKVEPAHEERIIGGVGVFIQRHPYHVYIEGENLCGGAIIDRSWIVTAANCDFRVRTTTVFAGEHYRGKGIPHYIKSAIKSPLFENRIFYYEFDIMLLELDRPLFYSPKIQPIRIGRESDVIVGKKGFVTGFGVTQEGSEMSHNLRKLEFTIMDNDVCKHHWHKNFHMPSQMCARAVGERYVWKGDFGGPFVVGDKLLGVVSYGHKGRDELVMLASVPRVAKWIYRITGIE